MIREFREFDLWGSLVDMAVVIIIGSAFGTIVTPFVSDVIMPPIGPLLGNVAFSGLFMTLREVATAGPYATLAEAQQAGAVTLNDGAFVNTIVSFLMVALAVLLLTRSLNGLKRQQQAISRGASTISSCPYCFMTIPIQASRRSNGTSALETEQ